MSILSALTGSKLIAHYNEVSKSSISFSRSEMVTRAGYVYPNGHPQFCDFYRNYQQAIVQQAYKELSKQKVVQSILTALELKKNYKNKNLEILNKDDAMIVYFYDKCIAVVYDRQVSINGSSKRSDTTKKYLNAIARHFTGNKVTQRNFVWWIGIPGDEQVLTQDWHNLTRI